MTAPTTLKLSLLATAMAALIACACATAWAHSFPEAQTPAAGQVLTTPPAEVTIRYDAQIEKLFANLEVVGPDGKNRAVGTPQLSADGRTLSVKLAPLGPGEYKVRWAVLGIDTHRTQGSYTFTVAGKGS
jgi:methionine-rich copper-binding protein CopC